MLVTKEGFQKRIVLDRVPDTIYVARGKECTIVGVPVDKAMRFDLEEKREIYGKMDYVTYITALYREK